MNCADRIVVSTKHFSLLHTNLIFFHLGSENFSSSVSLFGSSLLNSQTSFLLISSSRSLSSFSLSLSYVKHSCSNVFILLRSDLGWLAEAGEGCDLVLEDEAPCDHKVCSYYSPCDNKTPKPREPPVTKHSYCKCDHLSD